MRRLIRHRPSPAMIVALIALFVAMSGASYAALAAKSVGTKQLKGSAVTAAKIKKDAVTGAKVKDGSLGGAELADGSVALADLAADSVDAGKVVNGSLRSDDIAAGTFLGGKVTIQNTEATVDLADGTKASYDVFCPDGQIAIGGGARGDATQSEETSVTSSRPIISTTDLNAPTDGGTFTGWRATVVNLTGGVAAGIRPDVWVICAALP